MKPLILFALFCVWYAIRQVRKGNEMPDDDMPKLAKSWKYEEDKSV